MTNLVEHLFRHAAGRTVSMLARTLGPHRLDLAEECVQVAFVRALETWPLRGVPEHPSEWLFRVARNMALDRLRRESNLDRKLGEASLTLEAAGPAAVEREDDEASMILLCCHPEIPAESRIALTLKTVGGFSVKEIARGLLLTEVAAAQRIVRAKHTIQERALRFETLDAEQRLQRLPSALDVLYLMFNEGYAAHGGENLTRSDLCDEALRLTEILLRVAPLPEVHALLALMNLQASRLGARVDAAGLFRLLEDQDRSAWDRVRIARGLGHLEHAARGDRVSTFHLEAGIAAAHATAESFDRTDWPKILELYDRLMELGPSPVARLNRAVAVGEVHGPAAALAEIDAIGAHPALARYHLLHAARGEMCERAGRTAEAAESYRRALELPCTEPERVFLAAKLAHVETGRARSSP